MFNNEKQKQLSGNNSSNYQAGNNIIVNNGLTIDMVKELIKTEDKAELLQLFIDNYTVLRNIAKEVANERVEELTNKFNENLLQQEEQVILKIYGRLSNPDMQSSFFEAQKAFAKSEDKNKSDILSNLLIDKGKEDHGSLKDYLIDEAIEKISKLTRKQINFLSLFILKTATMNRINNLETLNLNHLSHFITYKDCLPMSEQNLLYLKQTNCISINKFQTAITFQESLKNNYKGLFAKGFSREEIENEISIEEISDLIVPCLTNNSFYQIDALNEVMLENDLRYINKEIHVKTLLKTYFNLLLPDNEIKETMTKLSPNIAKIFEDNVNSLSLELTPLGMIIGLNNLKNMSNLILTWDFN